MKKKLSILLAFAMLITMLTGCGMINISIGGNDVEELDAAYQLMDVSKYEYYNRIVGTQKGSRVEVTEGDAKLENVYSYEELGAYFTKIDVRSADIVNLFTMEIASSNDEDNIAILRLKDGYYTSGPIEMMFKLNDETYSGRYDQIDEEYGTAFFAKDDSNWNEDALSAAKFYNTTYMYQFNPSDELFSDSDGKQVIYVATQCENSKGTYTLIEEYENTPDEITYMLYVMNERNMIKADGSLKVPESEVPENSETEVPETPETPETEVPENTQDTQPSESEEPEQPSWSKPFMGKYFVLPKWNNGEIVGYENFGIYFDEEYVYYKGYNGEVSKVPISEFEIEGGEDGYYSITTDGGVNGYYYNPTENAMLQINAGYEGDSLYMVDKSIYDGIGSY